MIKHHHHHLSDAGRLGLLRMLHPLVAFVILMMVELSAENILPPHSNKDAPEYCQQEFFNVTCPGPTDVIIMESARFGRMRTGRCITGSYGNLGCSKDALLYFERKCSGRSRCKVFVGDPNLMKLNPCQERELTSYLEAKYSCVPAASGTTTTCRSTKHVSLSNSSVGFISSELASTNGIGTSECPLKIHVGQGQRIQLTLMVFTGKRMADDAEDLPTYQSNACFEIGAVYSAGPTKTLTACSGGDRRLPNLLYLSESNNITIQLHSKYSLKELSPFVIKYESYGCQMFTAPTGGWVKMVRDTAFIGCNGSEQESWTVTCSGTRWIGSIGNCTFPVSPLGASAATQSDDAFPYGILVVVAIGVALGVFIGGTLLTIVAFCMKRNSRQESALAADCLSAAEMIDDSYTRSESIIPDLRCTLHDDRRYRLNPGPLIGSSYPPPPPPAVDQADTLTTPYDDQDVILCRTGTKVCSAATAALLQPGHRSLHLYETPQFG